MSWYSCTAEGVYEPKDSGGVDARRPVGTFLCFSKCDSNLIQINQKHMYSCRSSCRVPVGKVQPLCVQLYTDSCVYTQPYLGTAVCTGSARVTKIF